MLKNTRARKVVRQAWDFEPVVDLDFLQFMFALQVGLNDILAYFLHCIVVQIGLDSRL